MDWLTFISSIVRDLAWPLVALAALGAVFYKGRDFITLVKTFKYKDIEITIREDFIEARADAELVKLQLHTQPAPNILLQDKILNLAKLDPALAIVDIWKKLEAQLINLIQHSGQMRFTTPEKFILKLADLGKITKNEVNLYRKLREIRNASVHSHGETKLTLAEVIEFRDFVDMLSKKFEQIKSEPGYIDVS